MAELSSRQFIIIAVFVMLTSKLVTMPSVVYAGANGDAIFSILINFAVELLLVFLITLVIIRNPNTDLFTLLKRKFTVVGAVIIYFLLAVYLILRLTLCYQELYSFFLNQLYDEFSPWLFAIPTFFVTGYIAYKGARTLGRSLEIMFWFILIGTIISVISNVNYLQFDQNLPYFAEGALPMLNGSLTSMFYFGNSLCLLFFVGKVDASPKLLRNTMLVSACVMLFILAICFVFYDVFGKSMQYVIFSLSEFSQYDPFILELQRLVWLTSIVDITKLFCSTICLIYCVGQANKALMQTKTTILPILVAFLLIFSIATIAHYDLLVMFEVVRKYLSYVTVGLIALMLIFIIILAIKRQNGDLKEKSDVNLPIHEEKLKDNVAFAMENKSQKDDISKNEKRLKATNTLAMNDERQKDDFTVNEKGQKDESKLEKRLNTARGQESVVALLEDEERRKNEQKSIQ